MTELLGNSETLKKCPFCGGEAILHKVEPLHSENPVMWRVVCLNCVAGTTGGFDKKHAINLWDCRKPEEKYNKLLGFARMVAGFDHPENMFCEEGEELLKEIGEE